MKVEFRKAESSEFSSELIQENMEPYYLAKGITWDSTFFDRHWTLFKNLEVYCNSERVGVVRFSFNDENCYIRDLQIKSSYQGRGIGSDCLHYGIDLATARGDRFIKLKVFSDNPAIALYQRYGFKKVSEVGGLTAMALELNPV